MKRTLAVLATALALTLTVAAAASAATLNDLRVLGYTVGEATQCETPTHTWLTVWSVSGFGMSTYLSECDPGYQEALDSIAAPAGHCNRKWQFLHPEQIDPWSTIERLGWTETADKCGDVFTVTNPNDQTVRYNGPGAGLPALAAVIGAPPVPAPPPPPVVVPPAPPAPPAPAPPAAPPTPQPPAPNPEPQPPAPTPVVPEPAPTPPATPTGPTITLTGDQLIQIIADAVTKALREQAAATRAHSSAQPSSHRRARARRQQQQRPSQRSSAAEAQQPLSRRMREGSSLSR